MRGPTYAPTPRCREQHGRCECIRKGGDGCQVHRGLAGGICVEGKGCGATTCPGVRGRTAIGRYRQFAIYKVRRMHLVATMAHL